MSTTVRDDERRVALTPAARPEISIVVLAWRLGDELLDCLQALVAQRGAPPFEVVIVSNGASSAARDAVARVTGAVVVELESNAGFGGGCAAGVAVARGSALVFVNDDAVVADDWLARLAARAAAPDRPVAVGSLLLSPDGTVQEAGSRLLASGGTLQFGRGATVDEARDLGLLDSRVVDYCSAAALWVDRAAFDRIGGFDERFSPAYYEDVDLQLRLALDERPVVVEPAAVAHHASGASTDAMPLYREFLGQRNGALFAEKWADTLAGAPSADAPVDQLCEVHPPHEPITPRPTAETQPHTVVAAEYLSWLTAQVRDARVGLEHAAAQQAEADEVRRQLTDLQREHHELAQSNHALFVHVQHLESETTLDRLRARLPHRRG